MKNRSRIAIVSGTILLATAGVALTALWLRPPELLRVGANYAAKVVCSNVFIAGRDPDEVLHDDVRAPGLSILKLVRASVDRVHGTVHAGFLGFIGNGLAVARPGAGCAVAPDGHPQEVVQFDPLAPVPRAPPAGAAWPDGESAAIDPKIERLIADDNLTGPNARTVLVAHRGRLVAERYGVGFDAGTPQLGWSMAKSVTAGLVGVLISQGRLTLDRAGFWPPGDGRESITLADLLAMSSGLRWIEGRGTTSDVIRMLFLEPDMAAFARQSPLEHPPGEHWNYSSGTAVILARIVQESSGLQRGRAARELLFEPLGMRSAIMEADAHGTLVGSSYLYATPRDWARYGQFLLQRGVWHGEALLPPGFVERMATPVPASEGQYGKGLVWLFATEPPAGKTPDPAMALPSDTFWLSGHDGQFIAVIRSRELVVVRLGLTPSGTGYRPELLVHALLAVLP